MNYVLPTTRSSAVYMSNNQTLQTLDDLVFPVGFIYRSIGGSSPASRFGGSWNPINGVFLLSNSDLYSNDDTGGEENVMLTIDTMSNHNHHGTYSGYSFLADLGRTSGDGFDMTVIGGNHYKYSADASTVATGGNKAHNNIPPYLVCSIWRRVP